MTEVGLRKIEKNSDSNSLETSLDESESESNYSFMGSETNTSNANLSGEISLLNRNLSAKPEPVSIRRSTLTGDKKDPERQRKL